MAKAKTGAKRKNAPKKSAATPKPKSAVVKAAAKKSAAKPKAKPKSSPTKKKTAAASVVTPAAQKTAQKTAKKTAKKTARPPTAARSAARPGKQRRFEADINLFAPLSEGERADALRTLTEDKRLATMTKVGRYRVIAIEPLILKPPHPLAGHRLARVSIYDYSTDRSGDACVDLDAGVVSHLQMSKAQPMLAREEEAAAVAIAMADERVKSSLCLGDEAQVAMHYWSRRESEMAYSRRSAAVLFGQAGARPSFIAVVDLLDGQVSQLVAAENW